MFRLTDLLVLFPVALALRILWAVVRPTAPRTPGRVLVDAFALAYAAALFQIVLGLQSLGGLGPDFIPWAHINLIPLRTISEIARPELRGSALAQVIGNVVLFAPLGALLPVAFERLRSLGRVLVTASLVSVGIELVQLAFLLTHLMNRAADIDDVILNTIGAVIGYGIWRLLAAARLREARNAEPALESEG